MGNSNQNKHIIMYLKLFFLKRRLKKKDIRLIKSDEKISFHSRYSGIPIFESIRRCIFEAERIIRCRLKGWYNITLTEKKDSDYLENIKAQYLSSCLARLRKFSGNIHNENADVFVSIFHKDLPEHVPYTGSRSKIFRAIFYIIHIPTAKLICKIDTEQCFSDLCIRDSDCIK